MTGEGHLDVPSLFRRHPAMATGSRPTESITPPSRRSGTLSMDRVGVMPAKKKAGQKPKKKKGDDVTKRTKRVQSRGGRR